LGSFTVSVPGASFTALASDSNTKILQSPQIRAMNDQKATLRIGDRVPIATGSFSPGVVGGGSVSALVSTQFQYLDVGVNIDITPHIHSDREVTLKMVLEISTVTGTQDIGGITQPVIGQRRIEHESRLVDGEVNVLGGILNDTDTQSMSGYPWISRIPILKYLFSQENKQRNESEIVFAVTPHIIRALEVTDENERMIAVGTGTATELRRNTAPAVPAASAHPGTPAKPQQPATQKPAVEAVPPGSSRLTPPQAPAVPQTKPGPSS
jgi:general secretion pathway protein D